MVSKVEAAQELLRRRRARNDFYEYRKYINPKLKTGWFVKYISYALQNFFNDYKEGKRPILVIEAPPQHGKSVAITDFICWFAGHYPDLKFIYASFSERLGIRANMHLQRTIPKKEYRYLFPSTQINDRSVVTSSGEQKNKEIIEFIGTGGSFRNTTVAGSVTGESLDIGIVDDPIKGRKDANSNTVRNRAWDWLNDDFMTRFDEMAGLLIILTRWHIDDPVGRLRAANPNVKVLRFPALADSTTTLMHDDPREYGSGDALFPEHKSVEFLLKRKGVMARASWESLYQQNPIVFGGNFFKSEWWKFYKELPRMSYRIIFADTAQKTKQENDYTVLQCWGKSYEGGLYLIDQKRGKWEAPELLVEARSFWNKHKFDTSSYLRAFKIEDKVSGTGLIQTLKREHVPVIGIQRDRDKITRAMDVAPSVECGNIFLPENAPWLSDYLTEFSQFPNGTHDDQVDPTMDAISDMLMSDDIDYSRLV